MPKHLFPRCSEAADAYEEEKTDRGWQTEQLCAVEQKDNENDEENESEDYVRSIFALAAETAGGRETFRMTPLS